jgi:hypothetical protein
LLKAKKRRPRRQLKEGSNKKVLIFTTPSPQRGSSTH